MSSFRSSITGFPQSKNSNNFNNISPATTSKFLPSATPTGSMTRISVHTPAATRLLKTKTRATTETQKTHLTKSYRRPMQKKTQTDPNQSRYLKTELSYTGYLCYCYYEKFIGKWLDIWILLYLCHLLLYDFGKNLDKWLDLRILTSLQTVVLLHGLDVLLLIQPSPFKLVLLPGNRLGMAGTHFQTWSCNYVVRCLKYLCCMFEFSTNGENIRVSPVTGNDLVSLN